jgi:23S rRNA G2445 N2-methylase RlmL
MGPRKRDLTETVRSAGFTPGVRDLPELFALLASDDDDLVKDTERAILRMESAAAGPAMTRAREVGAPLRGRLVRVIGKLSDAPGVFAFLIQALEDEDAKTRRNAVLALGKVTGAQAMEAEEALLAAWKKEPRVDHRRSIAASLGKIGGAASLQALRGVTSDDGELQKNVDRAVMQLERTSLRESPGVIEEAARATEPTVIVFRCRAGLEEILSGELGAAWSPRVAGRGVVEATLDGPLASVFAARTWSHVAFPLAARRTGAHDVAGAVVDAIASDEAYRVFRTWTRGVPRYRIAWEGRGHSRALVWRCAQGVSERRPTLVNDPTQSTWEATVYEHGHELHVELEPRAMPDPRFTYRTGDVPAASHPTLAAALARVAGAREDDVVWDPFVGSGSELVERARLGPYASLHGSDVDARALDVARANLLAAGISGASLVQADATTHAPPGVTLILTNPPMGRRVARGELAPLLDRFLAHAARALVPGGRLVWLSPMPERTRGRLAAAGLVLDQAREVDMGGFSAELQQATRPRARTHA